MKLFPRRMASRPLQLLLIGVVLSVLGLVAYWGGVEFYVERRFGAAEAAAKNHDWQESAAALEDCLNWKPNRFRYRFLAARVARRAGRIQDTENHLARCQALNGSNDNVTLLERTLLQVQQGRLADMEQPLWSLVGQDHPDKLLILEALARGYLTHARLNLAEKCLKMLVEEDAGHAEAWFWRGGVAELIASQDEAFACFQRATDLQPANDAYRLRLALFLVQSNRPADALRHLETLAACDCPCPDVVAGLAACRIQLGDVASGRKLLEQVLAQKPDHLQTLVESGKLALLDGDPNRAESLLHRALDIEPSNRAVNHLYHRCLVDAGQEEKAEAQHKKLRALECDLDHMAQIFRQELGKSPPSADAHFQLGLIFLRRQQPALGRSWLHQALAIDPKHVGAHAALVNHHEEIGDTRLATHHRWLSARQNYPRQDSNLRPAD